MQLVTVVGEPGVGKTRLVRELARLRRRPARAGRLARGPLPALRRGHHLLGAGGGRQGPGRHPGVRRPGDGRGQAGRRGRGRWSSDPLEREWLRGPAGPAARPGRRPGRGRTPEQAETVRRLAPVPRGGRGRRPAGPGGRGPALGRPGPARVPRSTWSSSPAGVPLLVVATARPELFDRAPGLGRRHARQCDHVPLAPLSDARDRPADRRPARPVGAARARPRPLLLERAGGNPLYAEEFVPHARRPGPAGARRPARCGSRPPDTVLPDTIQALIAARLDTLTPERQGPAPGRRRGRAGVLAGSAGRHRHGRDPDRHRGGTATAARARRAARSAPSRRLVGRRRGRVRLLARPHPRRRLRPDPADGPGPPPPGGRRVDRARRRRPGRRPRRAARPPLRPGARPSPGGQGSRGPTASWTTRPAAS